MGGEAAGKDFEFSDEDAGAIRTFGEELAQKALVPEVVDDHNKTAMETTGQKSVAMAVLDRGQALQQIKTQYVTAVRVQVPRDIGKIREAVLKEAELAGASFYYGWDVKGKGPKTRIEGPSIDMAMSLVRNYGNCVLENRVTQDETHFTFEAALIDLETGTTINRLFRQRKKQSLGGKMEADRQEDIVFQIGQSKAGRNVVVRAMPGWLVEQAIEAAKVGEVKRIDVKTLPETRQRAVKFFASHGVELKRIEKALEKPLDKWMAEDIVELRGMMTAIKEGRGSVDDLFPAEGVSEQKQEQTKKDQPKNEEKKDTTGVGSATPESAGKSEAPPVKQEPTTEKTKGKKKADKTAEPPAQAPQGSKPPEQPPAAVTQPPVAQPAGSDDELMKQPYDAKKIRLGIVNCPTGGMRAGKKTHTNYCMNTCKQAPTCLALRKGPQAAI
jgi:hypothetical protein